MTTKKPGRPTLTPQEAARAHEMIGRTLATRYNSNQSAFARDLGIKQPSLYRLISGEANPSRRTLQRLAVIVGIKHYEEILSGAASAGPPAPIDPRFPSKNRAVAAAEALELPDAAVRRMLDERPTALAVDPGARYWLQRAESFALEAAASGERAARQRKN